MTWPTVAVVTTNCDAGTDSPATFRSDVLDGLQKLNQMIAHVSTFATTMLDDTTIAQLHTTIGANILDLLSKSAAYTLVLADAGILHPASDANIRTFTIDGTLAWPVNSVLTFVNETSQLITISVTTDTLYLAGTASTGTRTIAQNGIASVTKSSAGRWIISGAGVA